MQKELVISVFIRDTSWVNQINKDVSIKKYRNKRRNGKKQ